MPIPEELIRRIILTTAKAGDKLIDPFGGSGTLNKVAYELGYDSISFDIDPDYCKEAENRLNKFKLTKHDLWN